jgi:FkbM family methyltransferase
MKEIFISPGSRLRSLLPFVKRTRQWAWKYYDRTGIRLVINGGKIRFMDAELQFPEAVGLHYATPLFWNGPEAYESATSRTIERLAAKANLFLDVGSNVGIYSVYVGVKFPHVKSVAFEPIPDIWEKNRLFHKANGLSENSVVNAALGDKEGRQDIFLPVYAYGWEEEQTATLRADLWQTREEHVEKIEIQCTTLDTFAAKNQLAPGPCCLKIDVENYEAAVLRGGKHFLTTRRPWMVCEILPGQDIDPQTKSRKNNNAEVAALIRELSYAAFAITNDGYFRITEAGFQLDRDFKDFLLLPIELISGDTLYLTGKLLDKLIG